MWSFWSPLLMKHMDRSSLLPAPSLFQSCPLFFPHCDSCSIIYCPPASLITFMTSMTCILPSYCKIQQKMSPLLLLLHQNPIHEVFVNFAERMEGWEMQLHMLSLPHRPPTP